MHRRSVKMSLALLLVLGLIFAFGVLPCFAQEQLTITTYYPSPYGSYNELQTNKLAVGDTNGDNKLTSADQPPENGQLYVARSVIYKPHTDKAAIDALPNPRLGELAYAVSEDEWYYYNGSWVAQGGGGTGYFLQCGNTCPSGTQWVGAARGGTAINGVIATRGYVSHTQGCNYATNHCYCDCFCSEGLLIGANTKTCAGSVICNHSDYVSVCNPAGSSCSTECSDWCATNADTPYNGLLLIISVCR